MSEIIQNTNVGTGGDGATYYSAWTYPQVYTYPQTYGYPVYTLPADSEAARLRFALELVQDADDLDKAKRIAAKALRSE